MSEEDRFAARDLVRLYPQWNGTLGKRWTVADGWTLELRRGETVDWLNEGPKPTQREAAAGECLMMRCWDTPRAAHAGDC
jgi:hypothetical protein